MAEHRRALRTARPVLAGAVVGACEGGAVRLRSGQHVVTIRGVAAAVDDLALFAERGLFCQIVRTVQLGRVLGDHLALGVLPRTLADTVARILRGLAVGGLGGEISAPGLCTRAGGLRQLLAVIIGTREAAE